MLETKDMENKRGTNDVKSNLLSPVQDIYDVVIVGGGLSGLACARALVAQHDFKPENILVLEAGSTLGGRVQNSSFDYGKHSSLEELGSSASMACGFQVELGAEIIHGTNTSITRLLKEMEILGATKNGEEPRGEFQRGSEMEFTQEEASSRREASAEICRGFHMDTDLEGFFCYAQGDGGPQTEPVHGGIGLYCLKRTPQNQDERSEVRWIAYDSKSKADEDFRYANQVLTDLCKCHATAPESEIDSAHLLRSSASSMERPKQLDKPDNKSMRQYLEGKQVSADMMLLLEAGYANTMCSSLSCLSFQQVTQWEKFWEFESEEEEGELKFKASSRFSYHSLIEYLAAPLLQLKSQLDQNTIEKQPSVRLHQAVTRIKFPAENDKPVASCEVTVSITPPFSDSQNTTEAVAEEEGRQYACRMVVVSCSPAVLKAGLIEFLPALPDYKLQALKSLDFRKAIKIFLYFKKAFWPRQVHGMICGGFPIPEIWFKHIDVKHSQRTTHSAGKGSKASCYCTGFVTADFADKLLNCPSNEQSEHKGERDQRIIKTMLLQLEELFALSPSPDLPSSKNEATPEVKAAFVGGMVQIWDEENYPYIRGGYHSPKASSEFDSDYSEKLGRPVGDRVFFCGEATNQQAGTTTQSAVDSGIRAANEVAQVFKRRGEGKMERSINLQVS